MIYSPLLHMQKKLIFFHYNLPGLQAQEKCLQTLFFQTDWVGIDLSYHLFIFDTYTNGVQSYLRYFSGLKHQPEVLQLSL